jgi:hypothetical protein
MSMTASPKFKPLSNFKGGAGKFCIEFGTFAWLIVWTSFYPGRLTIHAEEKIQIPFASAKGN